MARQAGTGFACVPFCEHVQNHHDDVPETPRRLTMCGSILDAATATSRAHRRSSIPLQAVPYVAQLAKSVRKCDCMAAQTRAADRFYDLAWREAVGASNATSILRLSDRRSEALWRAVKENFVNCWPSIANRSALILFNSVASSCCGATTSRTVHLVRPVRTEYMIRPRSTAATTRRAAARTQDCARGCADRDRFGLACPWIDIERDIRRVIRAAVAAHDDLTSRTRAIAPIQGRTGSQIQGPERLFFRTRAPT